LEEPLSETAAAELANLAGAHRQAGIKYHGQKTHEKKVLAYLERALPGSFTERELATVCAALVRLDAVKLLRRFLTKGKRAFPRSPLFFISEVDMHLVKGPAKCPFWKIQSLLQIARRLADDMPDGAEREKALEMLQQRELLIPPPALYEGMPFGHALDKLLNMFDGSGEFEDDFDSFGPFSGRRRPSGRR